MPGSTPPIYRMRTNDVLWLGVDGFCEEICAAVESWLKARGSNPTVAERVGGLPQIVTLAGATRLSPVGPL